VSDSEWARRKVAELLRCALAGLAQEFALMARKVR
jgi:hypothetical protein